MKDTPFSERPDFAGESLNWDEAEPALYLPFVLAWAAQAPRKAYGDWIRLLFGIINSWGETLARQIHLAMGEEKAGEFDRLLKSYRSGRATATTIKTLMREMEIDKPDIYSDMMRHVARTLSVRQGITSAGRASGPDKVEAAASKYKAKHITPKPEAVTGPVVLPELRRDQEVLFAVSLNQTIFDKSRMEHPIGDVNHSSAFYWYSATMTLAEITQHTVAGSAICYAQFIDNDGVFHDKAHDLRDDISVRRLVEKAAAVRLVGIDVDDSGGLDFPEFLAWKRAQSAAAVAATESLVFVYPSASYSSEQRVFRFRLVFDLKRTYDVTDKSTRAFVQSKINDLIGLFGGDPSTKDISRLWFGNSKATWIYRRRKTHANKTKLERIEIKAQA